MIDIAKSWNQLFDELEKEILQSDVRVSYVFYFLILEGSSQRLILSYSPLSHFFWETRC